MPAGGQMEKRLKGLPLSEGVAVARVCMFNEQRHSNLPAYRVEGDGVEREINRANEAIRLAGERLEEVRRKAEDLIGHAEAEIFVAQRMILEDPELLRKIAAAITERHINAETAVATALDVMESRLLAVENEYIRERATEFGEIKRRLLDVLGNLRPSLACSEDHCQRGKNRIIVAHELTPTLTFDMDVEDTMGFVTERGGRHSHAAILARAMGIPAVSGIPGVRDMVACGVEILIDGTTGDVVIWPSEETVRQVRQAAPHVVRLPALVEPIPGFAVMANIGGADDLRETVAMKADGVGLYRTEIDVMAAGRMLSEDELYDRYLHVFKAVDGLPVTYRLLDIGSDKPLPSLNVEREDNPALGWRGGRLLLGMPDLLRTQARALARVAQHGPIHVMYPMVVDLDQFLELRKAFEAAVADLPVGTIRHGVMFEVPSACLQARELLEQADFGSIGTNDVVQYLFAVDRNNERVAYDFRNDRPVLWNLLRRIARAGQATGKPVTVCGEMAGDPRYVGPLLTLGFQALSVSPRRIPVTRQAAILALAKQRKRRGQQKT